VIAAGALTVVTRTVRQPCNRQILRASSSRHRSDEAQRLVADTGPVSMTTSAGEKRRSIHRAASRANVGEMRVV
jgi:hypothetical protein